MTRPIREQAADLCSARACDEASELPVSTPVRHWSVRVQDLAWETMRAVVVELYLDKDFHALDWWAEAECRLREGKT